MAHTVTIKIPNSIVNHYESSDELRQDLYEGIIVRAFQKGFLSMRECAKLLEMTYEEFMMWLGERQVSFINAPKGELQESYKEFETLMQTYHSS